MMVHDSNGLVAGGHVVENIHLLLECQRLMRDSMALDHWPFSLKILDLWSTYSMQRWVLIALRRFFEAGNIIQKCWVRYLSSTVTSSVHVFKFWSDFVIFCKLVKTYLMFYVHQLVCAFGTWLHISVVISVKYVFLSSVLFFF